MKLARLRNNQPYQAPLPFPLAGVLDPGEVIVTRYSTERLLFLLGLTDRVDLRALVVEAGPDSASTPESAISSKSPPRDYFGGYATTVEGASTPIIWRAQNAPTSIKPSLFVPNSSVTGILTVTGNAADGTNFASYRRVVTMLIGSDGTLASSNSYTLGTDYETQGGTNVTLAFSGSTGMTATVLGVAGETYRWTASFEVQAYSLSG